MNTRHLLDILLAYALIAAMLSFLVMFAAYIL